MNGSESHRHPDRSSRRSGPGSCIRLHGLRHAHATLLLADGVPVEVVSEQLGREAADRFAALPEG